MSFLTQLLLLLGSLSSPGTPEHRCSGRLGFPYLPNCSVSNIFSTIIGDKCKYYLPPSLSMVTTRLHSDSQTELSDKTTPIGDAGKSGPQGLGHLVEDSTRQEDIPVGNGVVNTDSNDFGPHSNLQEDTIEVSPDLNPESNSTSLVNADATSDVNGSSKGLRKFLSSAKERFDSLEPGWAQRKTGR